MIKSPFVIRLFLFLFLVILVLIGHLFWVFVHAIIWSLILVSLFGGLHLKIEQRLKGRSELAAIITLSLVLVGVLLPGSYFIALKKISLPVRSFNCGRMQRIRRVGSMCLNVKKSIPAI